MAESITEATRRFLNRYEHLTLNEYLGQEFLLLDIPKRVANLEHYGDMKDVTGRLVDIGDVIAMGHSRYIDVRVGVVVGYTPKLVKVCEFRSVEYDNLRGLSYPTTINGKFAIIRKKAFKEVD